MKTLEWANCTKDPGKHPPLMKGAAQKTQKFARRVIRDIITIAQHRIMPHPQNHNDSQTSITQTRKVT